MHTPSIIGLIIALFVGSFSLALGKWGKVIGAIILIPALAMTIALAYREDTLKSEGDQLNLGITRTQVQQILGKPTIISQCERGYFGKRDAGDPAPQGCVTEYWYHSFFTPSALELTFDKADTLIHKQRWQTP